MQNEDILDSLNDPIEENKSETKAETASYPSQSDNKTLLFILAISTILASALAGFFYWQNIQLKGQMVEKMGMEDVDQEVMEKESVATPISTDNWKLYENNELGFSVKYPEDERFEILPFNDGAGVFIMVPQSDYGFTVSIEDNPENLGLEDWLENKEWGNTNTLSYSDFDISRLTIDNQEAIEVSRHNFYGGIYTTSPFKNNIYNISGGTLDRDLLDQILSTFKFLEDNESLTEASGSANGQ